MSFITKKALLPLLLLFAIAACKPAREVAHDVRPDVQISRVVADLQRNQADVEWFSTRFSGTAQWEGRNQPISGNLRIQRNQAIYVSIAPVLGIEVARALITPDSVKIVNRLESTYYLGDLRLLNQMFGTDIDFQMLQALFLGNDFPHFRSDQFNLSQEGIYHRLHAGRRMRTHGGGQPINQALTLYPDNMRIRTNVILEERTGRALRADYRSYENISGKWIPNDLQIMFADQSNTPSSLSMTFSRTTINEPQRMQFSIPARYTPVNLTD